MLIVSCPSSHPQCMRQSLYERKSVAMPNLSKADRDRDMTDEEIREVFSTMKLPDVPIVPLRPPIQQQPVFFFRITGDSLPLNPLR